MDPWLVFQLTSFVLLIFYDRAMRDRQLLHLTECQKKVLFYRLIGFLAIYMLATRVLCCSFIQGLEVIWLPTDVVQLLDVS